MGGGAGAPGGGVLAAGDGEFGEAEVGAGECGPAGGCGGCAGPDGDGVGAGGHAVGVRRSVGSERIAARVVRTDRDVAGASGIRRSGDRPEPHVRRARRDIGLHLEPVRRRPRRPYGPGCHELRSCVVDRAVLDQVRTRGSRRVVDGIGASHRRCATRDGVRPPDCVGSESQSTVSCGVRTARSTRQSGLGVCAVLRTSTSSMVPVEGSVAARLELPILTVVVTPIPSVTGPPSDIAVSGYGNSVHVQVHDVGGADGHHCVVPVARRHRSRPTSRSCIQRASARGDGGVDRAADMVTYRG